MSDLSKNFTNAEYKAFFYHSSSPTIILNVDSPFFTVVDANDAYLSLTGFSREAVIGQHFFETFEFNAHDDKIKKIQQSINEAIVDKKTTKLEHYEYDVNTEGIDRRIEQCWIDENTPVLNEQGEVKFIIRSTEDITELSQLRQKEESYSKSLQNQRQHLYDLLMQLPVGILILKGEQLRMEFSNRPFEDLLGRPIKGFEGQAFFDIISDLKGHDFETLVNGVISSGVGNCIYRMPVETYRHGRLKTVYVNFVSQPFIDVQGNSRGVIVIAHDVTDQVDAISQIEESAERAKLAIDAVKLGMFDLDLRSGAMITSDRYNRIFGMSKSSSRQEYLDCIYPEDEEIRKNAHIEALKTGRIFYEVRIYRKDGALRWIRAEGKLYYDEKKEPYRMLGTLQDITEERLAKQNQQRLVNLIENSVDLMSLIAPDGSIEYINKAGLKLFGLSEKDDFLKIPFTDFLAPHERERIKNSVLPEILDKGNWSGQVDIRNLSNGESLPMYNNSIRIDDSITGTPLAIGSVMRDLRAELSAKQTLADRELLLRNLTTMVPIGLWMSDEYGKIIYVNQTWIDWTGISLEDQKGLGWLNTIIPEDRQKTSTLFRRNFTEMTLYEAEFRIIHVDGQEHYCLATGSPQYRQDGSFSGYIGACMDITAQKNLEKQKDDFIGIASHELKTPVTSIKAYAQILKKILSNNVDGNVVTMISKMDNQIKRLTVLISDLLDVTKINTGQLLYNDEYFNFDDLVYETVEELQRTIEKQIIIKKAEPIGQVYGDRERLGQVIINFLTNANKYSPASEVINLEFYRQDDNVQLSVEDFGIGIAADDLDKVFDRFYRVQGHMQHTFPGLGLGLFISAEIIKREGGLIWVESEIGKGSTFSFTIPINKNIDHFDPAAQAD